MSDPPQPVWQGAPRSGPPVLITGATGTLGRALAHACEARGLPYRLTPRSALDLLDADAIARTLDQLQPWAVINAAGWVRVDEAEASPAACRAANLHGALGLASAALSRGLAFTGFSSDLVFDGGQARPYVEDDTTGPLNVYGASKADAETVILGLGGRALMVRTAAFFSPHDPHNFAVAVRRALSEGRSFPAADDLVVSPTYVPDLVAAVLDLTLDGETGLRHLANVGATTWAGFARALAAAFRLDSRLVKDVPHAAFGWAAPRPAHAALDSAYGALLPPLADAIGRFAAHEIDTSGEPPETMEARSPAPAVAT